jgi:non-specific serine/threonine protein kinase/serine/threonine-protein kinase
MQRAASVSDRSLTLTARSLRDELDWIPLKALRKDRGERYATAQEFADDIANYLEHRPLIAGPESRTYRVRKFLRRNRVGVTAAAGMLFLLVAGIATTTWQAVRATRALEAVGVQKRQTDAANSSLSAVNSFLTRDVLASAAPEITRGKPLTVLDALDNAALSIAGRFADDPSTQVAVRLALADAYRSLGRPELGIPHAQAAVALCEKNFKPEDQHTLSASLELGELLLNQDKLAEADAAIQPVLAGSRRAFGSGDELTLHVVAAMARLRLTQGKLEEAESLAREAVAGRQARFGALDRSTLDSQDVLAMILSLRGKDAEAETILRGVVQADRQRLGEDHPETMHATVVLANLLETQGHFPQSEELFRALLANARRVFPPDHLSLLTYICDFAEVLQKEGKLDEAEPLFREALDKSRRVLGADHDTTLSTENNFARLLMTRRQFDEAEQMYRDVVDQGVKKRGWAHPNVLISVMNYERFLKDRKRYDEAERLARQALASARQNLGDNHRVTMALMQDMGQILYRMGRSDEAEKLLRESLDRRRKALGNEDPDTRGALNGLSQFLIEAARYAEAEPVAAELYRLSSTLPIAPRSAASNMSQWGICLAKLGKYDQAEAPLREAYKRLEESGIRRSDAMLSVISCLADVYEHTNRPDEARKCRDEFITLQAATRSTTRENAATQTAR